MQRHGGASVSSQVDAEFAEAMFIKTELITEDSGQRFPGQSGGLRVGVVGGIGVDRYTELVAKQLEDIQTEVLPAVVVHREILASASLQRFDAKMDQLAREISSTSPNCTLSECVPARRSMMTSPPGGNAKS